MKEKRAVSPNETFLFTQTASQGILPAFFTTGVGRKPLFRDELLLYYVFPLKKIYVSCDTTPKIMRFQYTAHSPPALYTPAFFFHSWGVMPVWALKVRKKDCSLEKPESSATSDISIPGALFMRSFA